MLADIAKRNTVGQLKGPVTDRSILMVVTFVESHLEVFAQEHTRTSITNEKGLTQMLCILLNRQAILKGYPFFFEKEYMEVPERGDSPSVDIGVITNAGRGIFVHSRWYSNEESFFSMEEKLPDTFFPFHQSFSYKAGTF